MIKNFENFVRLGGNRWQLTFDSGATMTAEVYPHRITRKIVEAAFIRAMAQMKGLNVGWFAQDMDGDWTGFRGYPVFTAGEWESPTFHGLLFQGPPRPNPQLQVYKI